MSCGGVHVLLKGVGKSHGYCVVTDPEGDRSLFEVWRVNLDRLQKKRVPQIRIGITWVFNCRCIIK